jgi:hypothetical protein
MGNFEGQTPVLSQSECVHIIASGVDNLLTI